MSLITHLAARQAHKSGILNFGEGFRLLKDRNVPATLKLRALGIGVGLTMLLAMLEIPLEGVLAFFLPIVGELADLAIDGVEFVVLPLLFASLIIQRFRSAPPRIVRR